MILRSPENFCPPDGKHLQLVANPNEQEEKPPITNDGGFFIPESYPTTLFHGEVLVGRKPTEYTLELPEDPIADYIALVSPGYMGIKHSSRAFRNAMSGQQRIPTVTYNAGTIGEESMYESFKDPQNHHAKTLRAIGLDMRWKKGEIKKLPGGEQIDIKKHLLVGHSMGGLAITRYANMEPGSVYKMVGMMTCGLGYPTLGALAVDTPKNIFGAARHEILPAALQGNIQLNVHNLRDAINYCRRLRVLFEGLSCLTDNVVGLVDHLQDKGINYDYIAAKYDFLVRPDPSIANLVSHHQLINNIGHLGPQAKPSLMASIVAERALAV